MKFPETIILDPEEMFKVALLFKFPSTNVVVFPLRTLLFLILHKETSRAFSSKMNGDGHSLQTMEQPQTQKILF